MLQPSIEPSSIRKVPSIPAGLLMARAWAWESPTMASPRGTGGPGGAAAGISLVGTAAAVAGAAAGAAVEAAAGTGAGPDAAAGVEAGTGAAAGAGAGAALVDVATGTVNVASAPPAARSKGCTVAYTPASRMTTHDATSRARERS